jgi:hypothetical protein
LQNYGKRNSFFCARLVHYLGPEAIMLGFMQPEPKRSNSNISAIKPFTSGNRASILGTMCGRVVQSSGPPRYAIVHGLNVRDSRVSNYPPRWNAAPSQELLVIRRNHHTGEVSLDPLRWGLGDGCEWYWEVIRDNYSIVSRGLAATESAACKEASDAARKAKLIQ